MEDTDLEKILSTILLWRSGSQMARMEDGWRSEDAGEKKNRIELGEFLNHRLSLFAQFWGALAVCYEEIYGVYDRDTLGLLLQRLPTFVREGVSSLDQLHWLYAIGGLDRVLAHKLAATLDRIAGRSHIRRQVWNWKRGRETLPSGLDEQHRLALAGALDLSYGEGRAA